MLKRLRWCAGTLLACGLAYGQARERWIAPPDAKMLQRPSPADAKAVERGKHTFTDQCRPCHGKAGKGDGPMAETLKFTPADLSNAERMNAQQDGELFWKISKGREPMPTFEKKLTAKERWDVLAYVRTLSQ